MITTDSIIPIAEARVLIVDDDPTILDVLSDYLASINMESVTAEDGQAALQLATEQDFDVAIVDLGLPGISGLETIRRFKHIRPETEIIIFTGNASLESSLEAIREQVFAYLCKPTGLHEIQLVVSNAAERRKLLRENKMLIEQLERERSALKKQVKSAQRALEHQISSAPEFVGESAAIHRVRQMIAEVAPTDMTVLIRGESGTGKDVVARMIHLHSGSGEASFVKINCPAVPESLMESELFGHERGAFTGSDRKKPGRFELAENGTIFLDEIGEIPMSMQVKLLQAIEHKEFTRLGGDRTIKVNTRIQAATNAPLELQLEEGKFRSDLYFRLNEYSITVPPLRERAEDIPLLVRYFIQKYGEKYDRLDLALSSSTFSLMMNYSWPGNVRELETLMRRFALTGREEILRQEMENLAAELPQPTRNIGMKPSFVYQPTTNLKTNEVQTIMAALMETHWNQYQAAKKLGISYSTLRRRIQKYNLKEVSMDSFGK